MLFNELPDNFYDQFRAELSSNWTTFVKLAIGQFKLADRRGNMLSHGGLTFSGGKDSIHVIEG